MQIGLSTACFYPLETEKALQKVAGLGFPCTEIFMNTYSELEEPFPAELRKIADNGGVKVVSMHPFTSPEEAFMLFSAYERRYRDVFEFYKKYFETCAILGADILVIHGGKTPLPIPKEEYWERFAALSEEGKKFGVTVAQENVVNHCAESTGFLMEMRDCLGDVFKVNLDIKQAVRAKQDPYEMARAMAGSIVNVHINDNNRHKDCLPPGKGNFDFSKYFNVLKEGGYAGSLIIELYRHNYQNEEEILKSAEYLKKICKGVR